MRRIGRPEAVRNLDEIVKASDGMIVARGELAVEMGPEEDGIGLSVSKKNGDKTTRKGFFERPRTPHTQEQGPRILGPFVCLLSNGSLGP